jgi:hypothetical protein
VRARIDDAVMARAAAFLERAADSRFEFEFENTGDKP